MIWACVVLCVIAPEDSNGQYLLDKQIEHYFETWEVHYDSMVGGLRTSQGCLDLLNWYVEVDTKYEVRFGKVIGMRYRNRTYGDYGYNIHDHIFQPFFQLGPASRLLLSIAPHYYKGEDELGIGFSYGRDYVNFFEVLAIVEDFDRNFSLQHDPEGPEKIIYKKFPVKFVGHTVLNWESGRCEVSFDVSLSYQLQSTEPWETYPLAFEETGRHDRGYVRFWRDFNSFRIGALADFKHELSYHQDSVSVLDRKSTELILEPMLAYRINETWFPHLYLTYNQKVARDSIFTFSTGHDSLFHYDRNVYAYLVDVEFSPGGSFIWHFGTQREFYFNNQGWEFRDRRINLGMEFRYKNVWFYLIEAMEGDFPTPKYLHNHTYVHLMLKF